jgi:hypothetical protein
MTRTTWSVLAAVGISMSVPVLAYDPPESVAVEPVGEAEQRIPSQEAEVTAWQATGTIQVEEVRAGAGSMEPADTETDEEKVERDFVANVWNSP